MSCCDMHSFSNSQDLQEFRADLLEWYRNNRRELPWRERALRETDPNNRAYAVWVSEIMLQQTQVATVIDYYNCWMKKWPTVECLAEATLEEVNSMWSGLGYYSRGQRLWKGAKKVMSELHGVLPSTQDQLAKLLPGVGQYTAGAIASIAFGQVTGVVDGNVMRVFARHRLIGADISAKTTVQHFWELAHVAVDPQSPGDFNQALMELGATVCTPKSPKCGSCPVRGSCCALVKVSTSSMRERLSRDQSVSDEEKEPTCTVNDIEDCPLCPTVWNQELGVTNLPLKAKKKPPLVQHFVTAIMVCEDHLLLRKRPEKGLLAGLWEFPALELVQEQTSEQQHVDRLLTALLAEDCHTNTESTTHLGKVVHQFSHTHHHYDCWYIRLKGDHASALLTGDAAQLKWTRKEDVPHCAVPTSVKKMLRLLNSTEIQAPTRKRKRSEPSPSTSSKKQKTLKSFFPKKNTE